MLATLGSVAIQGSIFKGTVWDNGNNIFGLSYIGNGNSNISIGGRIHYKAQELIGTARTYGLDVSPLNILTDKVKIIGTFYTEHGTQKGRIKIVYEDNTFTELRSVSNVEINSEYIITTNPLKKIKEIRSECNWTNPGGELVPNWGAISYIEIL